MSEAMLRGEKMKKTGMLMTGVTTWQIEQRIRTTTAYVPKDS